MRHPINIITLLTLIYGTAFGLPSEQRDYTIWKIGFDHGGKQIADSSAHKIRHNYQLLYRSGKLTIAAHLTGSEKTSHIERIDEIREILLEGGISQENLRVVDINLDDRLKERKLEKNNCYLIFVAKDMEGMHGLGIGAPERSDRDTVISVGQSCYVKYTLADYHLKTVLPDIRMLSCDLKTKNELVLFERVNTRGFSREVAFFQFIKNDSDIIADNLLFPLKGTQLKKNMRLERYDGEQSAWMPIRDAGLQHTIVDGKNCIGIRVQSSGVYRLLDDPGKNATVLYFKSPAQMAFVKAELEKDAITVYEGVITDGETGVVFVLPENEEAATCRFILKDATGKTYYLPEDDWKTLVEKEIKIRKHNRRRIMAHGMSISLPRYAWKLEKDLHEVRTIALDQIK